MNLAGTSLMVAGIALLAYVGWTYQRSTPARAHSWDAAERKRGQQLAQELVRRQKVYIPRALNRAKLPPLGSEPALRIIIPRIGVDSMVVQTPPTNGVWEVADWAVGHLTTTANPGGIGNSAYSAHDDIKGEVFKRVGELHAGDTVLFRTRHFVYTYTVVNQLAVDPSNVSVLDPPRKPVAMATLVSCTPYWVDTQRVIIQAVLKSRARI